MLPPVLCYHRIGGPLELGVTRVSRTVFARQMTRLARDGWRTLTLDEYAAPRIAHRAPREFLLTFDDGYAGLAEHAYPVLRDVGFSATTFLITDFVGRSNTWDARYTWKRLPHLSWETAAHWQERGFAFASHGATHRRLTWLSPAAVGDELGRSREALVRHLGPAAGRAVAYPFGASDAAVRAAAEAAGYAVGFGSVRGGGGRYDVPRIPVYLWDMSAFPLGLRDDALGAAARIVAGVASRCAVGTSLFTIGRR